MSWSFPGFGSHFLMPSVKSVCARDLPCLCASTMLDGHAGLLPSLTDGLCLWEFLHVSKLYTAFAGHCSAPSPLCLFSLLCLV